jgi:hypothetical protein
MTSESEHRQYPRFSVSLPFRWRLLTGKGEPEVGTLLTQNISKAGLCFLAPRSADPGESIEVQVTLAGYGPHGKDINVSGHGYIVRSEASEEPGWYQLAAVFKEPSPGPGQDWNELAAVLEESP